MRNANDGVPILKLGVIRPNGPFAMAVADRRGVSNEIQATAQAIRCAARCRGQQ